MDETSFLDHLVAHGRVGAAIDALQQPAFGQRQRFALTQLKTDLQKGSSYVEEAVRLGVTNVLMKLMKSKACLDDESLLDDISAVIAMCSGPAACAGRVLTFRYGSVRVRIREAPLGDGLGARVWAIAHSFCRELAAHPSTVAGLEVLEIGAGTGLVGIVAALLGATRVVLTDNEPLVLKNLQTCMHLNAHGAPASSCAEGLTTAPPPAALTATNGSSNGTGNGSGGSGNNTGGGGGEGGFHGVTDAELFDDAESVEDFGFADLAGDSDPPDCNGNSGGLGASSIEGSSYGGQDPELRAAAAREEWEAGNMEVRLLDWQSSLEPLDGPDATPAAAVEAAFRQNGAGAAAVAAATAAAAAAAAAAVAGARCAPAAPVVSPAADADGASRGPPGVPDSTRFSCILGNETMYEPEHAALVAAVLAHRLAPGGRALLCSAVRFKEVFAAFRAACAARGLRHRSVRITPWPEDCEGGILCDDYDGGFVMLAVDRFDAPAADWHRDDFAAEEAVWQ